MSVIFAIGNIPEYSEDIYPYATFHLPEQENMASNPQLQALLYNESQHAAETLQMKQVKTLFIHFNKSSIFSRRKN